MTREELILRKKEKSLSVVKLSELSGVPVGTITKIISGETRKPRRDTMQALEKILLDNKTGGDLYPADAEGTAVFRYMPDPGTASMLCKRAVSYGAPVKKQGEYVFKDLDTLPEGRYAELIDGVIYDLAPPAYVHQMIAMEIYDCVKSYIRANRGNCEVFVNAFGVFADRDDKTYLIPDLSVVCDPEKIGEKGIYGPPDFVLEILSPSTASKDLNHKFLKYSQCGVKEYWIIDIKKRMVTAFRFFGDCHHYYGPLKGKLEIAVYGDELQIDLDRLSDLIRKSEERFAEGPENKRVTET